MYDRSTIKVPEGFILVPSYPAALEFFYQVPHRKETLGVRGAGIGSKFTCRCIHYHLTEKLPRL